MNNYSNNKNNKKNVIINTIIFIHLIIFVWLQRTIFFGIVRIVVMPIIIIDLETWNPCTF